MEEVKYIFTYITTNKLNNKQYVGLHATSNIEDGYLGSGKYIKAAIKKYGTENFERRILSWHRSIKRAHYKEIDFIKQYKTLVPNGYNIHPDGGGMPDIKTREKISKTNKGVTSPWKGMTYEERFGKDRAIEIRAKKSKSMSNNIKNYMNGRTGEDHPFYGKKHSEESINKMRECKQGAKNKRWGTKHSEETKKKISLANKGKTGRPAWNKGIPCSEETKLKISNTLKKRNANI